MGIIKDLVYFFVNYIVCNIPSRKIRMVVYYMLSSKNISLRANVALGVKFLDIRNISIAENSNVNFGCIIDGRGAKVSIAKNVDIAPQVNIWTMQHNVQSASHESESFPVYIEKNVWVANRAIILPGAILRESSVVTAGVTFKGELASSDVVVSGVLRKLDRKRRLADSFVLRGVRRFR